ncbi:MAG: ATP-binding protein [Muribaculaceae bacterium]|nr:ATP-binding protein [Muribaculaceae bacterium]
MRKLKLDSRNDDKIKSLEKIIFRPKNILHAFEGIVELVRDSELSEEFFAQAGPCIRYASRKLGISEMQAVLLSIFVDKSEDTRIRQSEIASFINVRTIRLLQLSGDLDRLVELHYIKPSKRHDDLTYRVPSPVIEALKENRPYVHTVEPVNDINDFFDRFRKFMKEKDNDEISYSNLEKQTFEILDNIKESLFARGLDRYKLRDYNKLLFIYMAHLYVENRDDNIQFGDIENVYDDDEIPNCIKRSLRNHENELFKKGLIENVNEDGMARSDAFKLTEKIKEELLGELKISAIGRSDKDLIKHDGLPQKKLIYNPTEKKQISELASILGEKRFGEVQKRLKENGMREGFCCIFYGMPGTGKTETVYQIARQTGRDILRVDVDKVKSCWVGESEKNIKGLFDRYRNICKDRKANGGLAPILLFNEADAVLGVRMEGASRAVDKMENSIQNIILQEMESLEGIMLATTNLTTNLDKAFERRFLYKVKFDKPTVEARAEIWRAMLPGLKKKDALNLAAKFDLSGGEIENVVRRHTVNTILSGAEKIDIPAIEESCRLERITNTTHTKVGF